MDTKKPGRPPKYETRVMQITVYIPQHLLAAAEAACAAENKSRSEWINEAIEAKLHLDK